MKSLLLALLRGIAVWRLAIWNRIDWLSLATLDFCGDSFVWIICYAFLIAIISA